MQDLALILLVNGKEDFTKHDWKGKNVLLVGSEGYGLKYQTLKNADFLLKIHINDKIESLNISNSAAIAFHYSGSPFRYFHFLLYCTAAYLLWIVAGAVPRAIGVIPCPASPGAQIITLRRWATRTT